MFSGSATNYEVIIFYRDHTYLGNCLHYRRRILLSICDFQDWNFRFIPPCDNSRALGDAWD